MLPSPYRAVEIGMEKVEHRELLRSEVLRAATVDEFEDFFWQRVFGELLNEICDFPRLHDLHYRVLDLYKLIAPVLLQMPVKSVMFKKQFGTGIFEVVFHILRSFALACRPKFLFLLDGLCGLKVAGVIEAHLAAAYLELRKMQELFLVVVAECLSVVQTENLRNLGIRRGGNLVELDIFAREVLFIQAGVDVPEQLVFLSFQRVGQKVIDAFVSGCVLQNIAEINFKINTAVLHAVEILLVVLDGREETFRPPIYRIIDGYLTGEVKAVAIEQENNFLDMAGLDEFHNFFRESPFVAEILNSGHGHAHDAVLAGLLRFLFSFLDEQTRNVGVPSVEVANFLRNVYERRRAGRGTVLYRTAVFVRVLFRKLVTHAEIFAWRRGFILIERVGERIAVEVEVTDY